MSFGFSVGDVIASIELIQKLLGAFKSATGANAEYQRTIIELGNLEKVLRDVGKITPSDDGSDKTRVESLRATAFATSLTLHDFSVKFSKYEASLGPAGSANKVKKMTRAMRWTMNVVEEVDKLQLYIAAQMLSISTMLQLFDRDTANYREARRRTEHVRLLDEMNDHKDALRAVNDQITPLAKNDTQNRRAMESVTKDLIANTRLLVGLQQSMTQNPSLPAEDNIKLNDALGRSFSLPYTYFNQWEVFSSFVKQMFSGIDTPGKDQVHASSYVVSPDGSQDKALSRENWSASMHPGVGLMMTIILTKLKMPSGKCPKPSCGSTTEDASESGKFITCPKCGLIFRYHPDVTRFGLSGEEDQLHRLQRDDDIGKFGRRPLPKDIENEPDDDEMLASPSLSSIFAPKVDARARGSEGQPLTTDNLNAFDNMEPTKSKNKNKNMNAPLNPQLPAVDWNSGPSGMDAWLNVSAFSSMEAGTQHTEDDAFKIETEQLKQERKDIEALKRVHFVSLVPETKPLIDTVEKYQDLPVGTQVYVRKIVDRYPNIPPFLAKRFANANVQRLDRPAQKKADQQ